MCDIRQDDPVNPKGDIAQCCEFVFGGCQGKSEGPTQLSEELLITLGRITAFAR